MLNFSEPINTQLSWAEVVSPAGRSFASEGISSAKIEVPLYDNEPGVYRVDWTTV